MADQTENCDITAKKVLLYTLMLMWKSEFEKCTIKMGQRFEKEKQEENILYKKGIKSVLRTFMPIVMDTLSLYFICLYLIY